VEFRQARRDLANSDVKQHCQHFILAWRLGLA
jgi:hypothetical protein